MAWWQYVLAFVALSIAGTGIFMLWRAAGRPICPFCYFPVFKCECRDEQNVERTVRRSDSDLQRPPHIPPSS